jgi:hypothetical protein
MTTRTKATVAEGIVSQEQLTSGAEAFRYEYEPGNSTCYEVCIAAWEDGRALVALWPGRGEASSSCVVSMNTYIHEHYVAEKLRVGPDDALVLAEFLGHVLGCDAPVAGPAEPKAPEMSEPGAIPRQGPRPTFTSFEVRVPTLIFSLEDAIEKLGEGEGGALAHVFAVGGGMRGVWALPHPDAWRETDPPEHFIAMASEAHAEALAEWAREADRPGGTTAFGPKFTAAMEAARAVRDVVDRVERDRALQVEAER